MAATAPGFGFKAGAGITEARVLVHADEKDTGVGFKTRLRAVAVVDVKIDNGDLLRAMFLLKIFGSDGDVGEETESHRMIRLGMMAGRPHGGEGSLARAVHDRIAALENRPQRQ